MKKVENTILRLKTKALKELGFTSSSSIVIDNYQIVFSSSRMMMDSLKDMSIEARNDDAFDYYIPDSEVEVFELEDIKMKTKAVEDMFDEALSYFLKEDNRFYGEMVKYVSDDEPAFMMELYGMQDALAYAFEDFKNVGFAEFLAEMNWWWVIDITDCDRAIAMMKKFFDSYYLMIRDLTNQ